jgi:hypothetical protein
MRQTRLPAVQASRMPTSPGKASPLVVTHGGQLGRSVDALVVRHLVGQASFDHCGDHVPAGDKVQPPVVVGGQGQSGSVCDTEVLLAQDPMCRRHPEVCLCHLGRWRQEASKRVGQIALPDVEWTETRGI